VPENLTGSFRIVPKFDSGPFEARINDRMIGIEKGRLLENSASKGS